MKNIILLFSGVMLTSGCAATLTPGGNIYTELLVPSSTVIVEEPVIQPAVIPAPRPVVVSAPRPVIVSSPRPPKPHQPVTARPYQYAKNPGPRGGGSPRGGHQPNGQHNPPGHSHGR